MEQAKDYRYISVNYRMSSRHEGEEWLVREETQEGFPYNFVTNMGTTLEAFEAQLSDKMAGTDFDFVLSPEEAYGPHFSEGVHELPRSAFEINGKIDDRYIYVGAVVPLQNPDGERFNGTVVEITEASVWVDLNHPLAGCELRFEGQVLDNHVATATDVANMAKELSSDGGCCGGSCGGSCGGGCGGSCDGDSGCGGCKS